MFRTAPVTRLSSTTTSSPRASSASHKWEPRKPPPPLTTTRAIRRAYVRSCAPDALVVEASTAQRLTVEEVAAVDDTRRGQCVGHLVEIEPLELVPLREHEQHLGTETGGVGISSDLDALEVDGAAGLD